MIEEHSFTFRASADGAVANALSGKAAGSGAGRLGRPALRIEWFWPSQLDPGQGYGVAGDLLFRISLVNAPARQHDVRAEADLLRRCQGIPGIPSFVAWTQSGAARVLVLQRLDAQPLSQLEIGWLRLGAVLLALGGLVVRLAWRGISHNDLQPENILLDRAGRIHLVDFDQVSSGSFVLCLARSFSGLRLIASASRWPRRR